ncbi:MAG: NADH-quinone oxidoreductase subunit H [Armatimonadota bacterium]|nr:NADH-quinone oxidoreductase subunit H [Armatimonadota bacterium]
MTPLWVVGVILLSPVVGGLLIGLDRKISARMQGRVGPPITQPFYDLVKLFSKSTIVSTKMQLVSVYLYLTSVVLSVVMLMLGQDLLVLLFVLALGSVSLILGAFSVRSPYSQLGAYRELLLLLSYEPLLALFVVGVYLATGSFMVRDIFKMEQPLLLTLPLFALTQILVLAMKMNKSPFDISASHHAHQEIVRGILTEFSGPYLGVIELTHWYELVLLLGMTALLWTNNLWGGAVLALSSYFIVILLDSVTARMTWRWALRVGWGVGIPLAVINLMTVYLERFRAG